MIAESLRKSIFQAAIQGKLTEQLPEDGDARELLARITEEKAQLIKEGKIKKERPLPEITEDKIPFDIPENWCWVRLGTIGYAQTGTTPDTSHSDYYGRDIPFIKPPYIFNDRIDYEAEGLSELGVSKGRLIKKNSILMVCIGGSTGKTYYCDRDICCNQQINTITTYSIVNMKYVHKAMQSQFFQEKLWGLATGTATTIVNKENWRQLLIPLPPVREQHRIVSKIDSMLPELEKLEKDELKLDLLQKSFPKRMKDSLLQAAIQGKLTEQRASDGDARELLADIQKEKERLFKEGKIKKEKALSEITEDEIPFDIPDNWCWVRFGEIFSIGSAKRVHQKDWRYSGIPFYRAREIAKLAEQGFVDNELFIDKSFFEQLKKESGVPQVGDLMVTGVGTLGKTYIVKESDEFYYKDASVLCINNYGNIEPEYFKHFMESPFMKQQINSNSSGTTVATLTIARFEEYIFVLPPLIEQLRIVKKLKQLLPLCDALE